MRGVNDPFGALNARLPLGLNLPNYNNISEYLTLLSVIWHAFRLLFLNIIFLF